VDLSIYPNLFVLTAFYHLVLRVGQFGHLKKISLFFKKSEAQSQRREKKNTLREPWIVHIFIAREKQLSSMDPTGKLYRYQTKLSVI